MERLPEVTPSLGLTAVEARTIWMRERSTSSSSAAIWANAVTIPCPISTLPGESVTCPCGENLSQADSFGFAARLTGSLGEGGAGWFIRPPSRLLRAAPPARYGYASRNGRGCHRELPLPRDRWAKGCASKARPRSQEFR